MHLFSHENEKNKKKPTQWTNECDKNVKEKAKRKKKIDMDIFEIPIYCSVHKQYDWYTKQQPKYLHTQSLPDYTMRPNKRAPN